MSQIVFLLSPANSSGKRAEILLRGEAQFDLALRLRESGLPLGDAFSFMSGLYFRGKLAYSRAFGVSETSERVLVLVPGWGLVSPDRIITIEDLRTIATVNVAIDEPRFQEPLERDARILAERLGPEDSVVLLGSIATDKYVATLQRCLGNRLRFPAEFVGRGDMSRGGLMLRCVSSGDELAYIPLEGAVRRGRRPPKLLPRLPIG